MKRILITALVIMMAFSFVGQAREIMVGSNQDCKSIGEAVNKARRGDTITIEAGTYADNVTVKAAIHFRSASGKPDVIWKGVSGEGEVGAIALPPGTKGSFSISGIQFNGFKGWIFSLPKQAKEPRVNVEFENCMFESSVGIIEGVKNVSMEECQAKGLKFGIARCKSAEIEESSFTKVDVVFKNVKQIEISESSIDTSKDVFSGADRVIASELKIVNTERILFDNVKDLILDEVEIENGGILGSQIGKASMKDIKISNCSEGFNITDGDIRISNGTFSNIKDMIIVAREHRAILNKIDVSFCQGIVDGMAEVRASNLKVNTCEKVFSRIGSVTLSDAEITQVSGTVFDRVTKLTVEDTSIMNGGIVASRFSGTFEDVKIENFKKCFVENLADLKLTDVTINKINDGPGIDANKFKLTLNKVTISSCQAGIVNSPDITAIRLRVTGCGVSGVAAPAPKE